MKKIYQTPMVKVVSVTVHKIIASSPDARLNLTDTVDAASVESRGYDFDDYEDE